MNRTHPLFRSAPILVVGAALAAADAGTASTTAGAGDTE